MRISTVGLIALGICLISAMGASIGDDDAPAFEVAALKLSGPVDPLRQRLFERVTNENMGMVGGDGQRVEIKGMSAAELIAVAYRIPLRQVAGASWMFDTRFELEALIPAGQKRDKAPEMLLTLLQERLALKAHRETRKMSGYSLTIAEGGPKLPEAPPFKPTSDIGARGNGPRFNGFRANLNHADMAHLVNLLAEELNEPVEDKTALQGFYKIEIQIPGEDMRDEFARPAAFRDALKAYGLRLPGGKIDAPVLVIDNLSKTPAEN